MKKSLISVASFLVMLLNISCINEFTERVEGLLSASQSGFAIVNAYDLGSKYEINLSVAKGGLQEQSCIVTYDDGSLVIPLKDEQLVAVKACDARYIRLIMNSTTSGVGHMAEVYVYGTDK